MNIAIWSLSAAAFAMVTMEFNIVGVVPLIARDLDMPVSQVGLLVTAFAFTVAVSGPFLTMALGTVDRRRLFTCILAVSAIGAFVSTVAQNYWILAAGRIISALALPVFWSMASSTAARIAGPERSGKAISTVFAGVSLASVLGVPLTTLLAGVGGWRFAFAADAILCAVMALILWLVFPKRIQEDVAARRSFRTILTRGEFLAHLLLSLTVLTAMFTAYTYFADSLERLGGYSQTGISWALIGFGAAGLIGNSLAGRSVDSGPMRTSLIAAVAAGIAMALTSNLLATLAGTAVVLGVWGAAHAASFVANHVRVIKSSPQGYEDLAASMNVTVFNTGIGLGAVVGGHVMDLAGLPMVGTAAAVIVLLALVIGGLITWTNRARETIVADVS